MKIGDAICFENEGTLFGNLIEKFTGSRITHVGMVYYGNTFIEASLQGIRIVPIDKIKNRAYWLCELKAEHRKKFYRNDSLLKAFIAKQVTKPYDFAQIAKFIPFYLTGGLYTPKEDNSLYVCSELVFAIYELMKVLTNVNSSIKTPNDVLLLNIFRFKTYQRKVI